MKTSTLQLTSLLVGVLLTGTALLTQSWVRTGNAASTTPNAIPSPTSIHKQPEVASPHAIHAARIAKVQHLVTLGEQSVPSLAAQFTIAQTGQDKTILCDALVRIGSDAAMQAFINAVLAEKNEATRIEMLQALDVVSSPAVLELTTSLGTRKHPGLRCCCSPACPAPRASARTSRMTQKKTHAFVTSRRRSLRAQ